MTQILTREHIFLFSFTLIVLIFDVLLILKSKRKKKYGVYPGFGTLTLIGIICVLIFYVFYSAPTSERPLRYQYQHKKYGGELYEIALKNYQVEELENMARLESSKPYFSLLFRCLKIQLFIGLALSIYGKVMTTRRDLFYLISISSYAIVLAVVFLFASNGFGMSI